MTALHELMEAARCSQHQREEIAAFFAVAYDERLIVHSLPPTSPSSRDPTNSHRFFPNALSRRYSEVRRTSAQGSKAHNICMPTRTSPAPSPSAARATLQSLDVGFNTEVEEAHAMVSALMAEHAKAKKLTAFLVELTREDEER